MYKDENDGKLVGGGTSAKGCWVSVPPGGRDASAEEKKEYIKKGLLWPFVKKVEAYRCPSDRRNKSVWHKNAYRTYSIPGGMSGLHTPPSSWEIIPCIRYSDIKGPATKYVFLAECDVRGMNLGPWMLRSKSRIWVDPFAIWHSRNRSTLGFADGHVDMHRWYSETLIEWNELALWEPHKFSFWRDPMIGDSLELEDFEWALRGYAYKALK